MPAPTARSAPIGYANPANGQQHINYVGHDNHVHELHWFDGAWFHHDLNAEAGVGAVGDAVTDRDGDAAGFIHSDGSSRVYYNATNGPAQLSWNKSEGRWQWTNLSNLTQWNDPFDGMTAFFNPEDDSTHAAYIGRTRNSVGAINDGPVIGLARTRSNFPHIFEWSGTNLTREIGGPALQEATGTPCGYVHPLDNTLHISYRNFSGRINEFWFDGSWHHADLFAAAGVPDGHGARSDPKSYVDPHNGFQHVIYLDRNQDVIELWWNGHWQWGNLSALVGQTFSRVGQGYIDPQKRQRIPVLHPTLPRVQLLWFDGVWHLFDLGPTQGHRGPADEVARGYVNPGDNTEHIPYLTPDGAIHEVWSDGHEWFHSNISSQAR